MTASVANLRLVVFAITISLAGCSESRRECHSDTQPGLADFIPTYGPAMLLPHKETHPCREFVVVTPCCSNDVWWLRYPVEHDSTEEYASSVEDCMRETVAMIRNVGLSPPNAGARLVGQSMGAYMALELARAMPENTAASASGAPCFDACRLDRLARRLVSACVVSHCSQ